MEKLNLQLGPSLKELFYPRTHLSFKWMILPYFKYFFIHFFVWILINHKLIDSKNLKSVLNYLINTFWIIKPLKLPSDQHLCSSVARIYLTIKNILYPSKMIPLSKANQLILMKFNLGRLITTLMNRSAKAIFVKFNKKPHILNTVQILTD